MKELRTALAVALLIAHVNSAPQLISFKDGKLGVNFGGYHAGVGIGGLLGGGAGGGLFAEAGTPFGQSARAGLGGAVDGNGGSSAGGLYAGATAGGNVKAEAGLSGGVAGEKSAGVGFANAQAGDRFASSGLGGESSLGGSYGFSYSGTKSAAGTKSIMKEVESAPVETVEIHKPTYKKVHKEYRFSAENEVQPTKAEVEVHESHAPPPPPPMVVKEVVYQPVVKTKPRHHNIHKTAFLGGYVNHEAGTFEPPPPPPSAVVVTKPVFQKRIDVVAHEQPPPVVNYNKQVTVEKQLSPTFFRDIFNIPISAIGAFGALLGNAAANTKVSVEKSASISTDAAISPKHASKSSSSQGSLAIETPSAASVIDGLIAIPINTLGAVSTFLENNVPVRKQVTVEGGASSNLQPTRVRLGKHARRRANKHVYIVEEPSTPVENPEHKE